MKSGNPTPDRPPFAPIRAIRGFFSSFPPSAIRFPSFLQSTSVRSVSSVVKSSLFPPFAFRLSPSSSGSSLILTLLLVAILSLVAVGFLSTSRIESIATKNFTRQNAASGLAELATQQAIAKIQQGFTVNGTGTTIITTQPGAIRQFVFSGGAIQSNRTQELFSGTGNTTTNGTANLNNLENPAGNSTASQNQLTITGAASERITVPMEEITSNGTVIGRVAYYVDDEGTKLNANNAIGNRNTLNAASRPQDIAGLVSTAQATSFSGIVNNSTLNNSSITGWSHFFRPEQVRAALSNFDSDDFPHLTTATTLASTTANMSHLLTPWGTQRLYINALSTNAIDGTGDASVNAIHAALTNSTLTDLYGGNFSNKYTSLGVKQIAANMLQMRDPNTATVNASFSYQGPLIGSRTLNASTSIPQEYLGYAPYPVISEVSADVQYNNTGILRPFIVVNVELYNPYPINFNAPNATIEYCIRGLTWTMSHTIISSNQTFGPFRYGGYGNWTDTPADREFGSSADLRDSTKAPGQLDEGYCLTHNPYGMQGINIPAYSKKKYYLTGPAHGTFGQAGLPSGANATDYRINSFGNVSLTITYIKICSNSTIAGSLTTHAGRPRIPGTNINTNTIRDWVLGADIDRFIPNNGNLSFVGGGSGTSYMSQGVYSWPPANTTVTFPRNWGGDWLGPANSISGYSYQRLCPLIKTSMAASSNLTASTRSWTANASSANQTFGDRTFTSNLTTATQTEQLNDGNARPSFDAANAISSDPSFNNFNGNAIYANATESKDMRIPELPSFSGNYLYTCPADLGFVPTNQRWRRLRMQMQPSSEGAMIPDWAMLDVISFGNSTDPNNAFNRTLPVNINGRFHLPGNITNSAPPAPRTIGVRALTQVLSFNGTGSIQNPLNPASSISTDATRFKGSSVGSTTLRNIANAIGNMTWSGNSSWGNATTGKRWKINGQPINQYILPSEIMEIAGVADAVSQTNYNNSSSHFKWNEGRASALIPAVTTRSSFFMIYAYAQALDRQGNIDSEALTKTLAEVQYNSSTTPPTYTVKKLYTQAIPLGQ